MCWRCQCARVSVSKCTASIVVSLPFLVHFESHLRKQKWGKINTIFMVFFSVCVVSLETVWNHLGSGHLGMLIGDYLKFIEVGRPTPCGLYHSLAGLLDCVKREE